MNIIKKAIRTTLPVLAAVFALAGCVKEHPVDGTGGVPKTGTTFTILLPEAEVVETRAANHTVDENRIDKLHVLSFNSFNVLIGDYALDEAALVPTSEAENKNILKFTVILPLGAESLMFVADLPTVNESALNTDGSVVAVQGGKMIMYSMPPSILSGRLQNMMFPISDNNCFRLDKL